MKETRGLEKKRNISLLLVAGVFLSAAVYFYALLIFLYPFLEVNFNCNPAVYWFITGLFLFIPLFVYPVVMVRLEGNQGLKNMITALGIKKITGKDWLYAVGGLTLIFILSGLIFIISMMLSKYFGIPLINTQPWFMEQFRPFKGWAILLLLVWLAMFFFNIVGEEIIWRGYLQERLLVRYSWLWCSLFWSIFHLPFGLNIVIMAAPALLIIPYIYSKTRNTTIGIFIHGLYNGPIFIAISLGLLN